MNKVYESDTMIIHDDREFITPLEAFEILISGKSIQVCDPPDYCAENDWDVHSMPFTYRLADIPEEYKNWPEMAEYLRGYELSR